MRSGLSRSVSTLAGAALLLGLALSCATSKAKADPSGKLRAGIGDIVSDPVRAEAAKETLKQGDKDLKAIAKEIGKIAKAFRKADQAQSTRLDELTPFMQQASGQRRISQEKSLDRVFELRQILTEQEWAAVLAHVQP